MYSSHAITRLKNNYHQMTCKYYLEKLTHVAMSLVLLDLPEAAAFPSPSPHQLLHLASQNCTNRHLTLIHYEAPKQIHFQFVLIFNRNASHNVFLLFERYN